MAAPAEDEDEHARASRVWDERKSARMAGMLGQEHDMVMHAVFPYFMGGSLDLYYYPHGIPGTAIATKELANLPGEGSNNDVFQCYELVMFTRHPIDLDAVRKAKTPFGKAHQAIGSILNAVARYSAQATLNPGETLEFPDDFPDLGGRCLIFDGYPTFPADDDPERADFGLLAVIEVFRSEMDYARKHGGGSLLARLKAAGHYPYSDLDRKPVA